MWWLLKSSAFWTINTRFVRISLGPFLYPYKISPLSHTVRNKRNKKLASFIFIASANFLFLFICLHNEYQNCKRSQTMLKMHHNRIICESIRLINKNFAGLPCFISMFLFFARRCMNFSLALHNRNEFVCMDLMPAACAVFCCFFRFLCVFLLAHAHTHMPPLSVYQRLYAVFSASVCKIYSQMYSLTLLVQWLL